MSEEPIGQPVEPEHATVDDLQRCERVRVWGRGGRFKDGSDCVRGFDSLDLAIGFASNVKSSVEGHAPTRGQPEVTNRSGLRYSDSLHAPPPRDHATRT
jgi:hypothetical protein